MYIYKGNFMPLALFPMNDINSNKKTVDKTLI
jgi:hypothetical protein